MPLLVLIYQQLIGGFFCNSSKFATFESFIILKLSSLHNLLKNCFPKGIPTIVMQRMSPKIAFSRASSHPKRRIQKRFKINDPVPPSSTTSFPNGLRAIDDILKHCFPTGIPIIVMHHTAPAIQNPNALKNPPKIIHRIFNNILILPLSF